MQRRNLRVINLREDVLKKAFFGRGRFCICRTSFLKTRTQLRHQTSFRWWHTCWFSSVCLMYRLNANQHTIRLSAWKRFQSDLFECQQYRPRTDTSSFSLHQRLPRIVPSPEQGASNSNTASNCSGSQPPKKTLPSKLLRAAHYARHSARCWREGLSRLAAYSLATSTPRLSIKAAIWVVFRPGAAVSSTAM